MNEPALAAREQRSATITVRKLAPAVGAVVSGVDLSQPLDDATFAAIERAWHEHGVLLFREQTLDDLQEVAFAMRFGDPAETLKRYESGRAHPAIMYVTNEKKDGKYTGALRREPLESGPRMFEVNEGADRTRPADDEPLVARFGKDGVISELDA